MFKCSKRLKHKTLKMHIKHLAQTKWQSQGKGFTPIDEMTEKELQL